MLSHDHPSGPDFLENAFKAGNRTDAQYLPRAAAEYAANVSKETIILAFPVADLDLLQRLCVRQHEKSNFRNSENYELDNFARCLVRQAQGQAHG